MATVPEHVQRDNEFGFLDRTSEAERIFNPTLVSNHESNTMQKAIREELRRSKSFTFSVAFISAAAIASLKQPLIDFAGRGKIITSTYLGFNSPETFRELLNLSDLGIDVYVYEDVGRGFHSKGFIFEQESSITAIVGSSNITSRALNQNCEWNLRFSALPDGDIVEQIHGAVNIQLESSARLTSSWIDYYEDNYVPPQTATQSGPWSATDLHRGEVVEPNAMQTEALYEIDQVREDGAKKALVISATGTGKTILAALDVKAANPSRVLFVVHREQIADRAMEEFKRVLDLDESDIGRFVGSTQQVESKFVFATVQSIGKSENLRKIAKDHFEYILIDEVHRAGAQSYRNIVEHFEPKFLLGMTATPERTDGFSIYSLFDYCVPYEIRLQKALEADMLVPFHYYGITDYEVDGEVVNDASELRALISNGRISHIISAFERYGHAGHPVKGLIFCRSKEEARELSRRLNRESVRGKRLRTKALTGEDPVGVRQAATGQLESGALDYIITVDIFNEGIDIRTVNQVVMLRQTQSSIIFTQQLGRGLRKASGKTHLIVIDFIGNYANNFLVPIALFGDSSLNKDTIRRKMIEAQDSGAISGLSSVNFDLISKERIFKSLEVAKLDEMGNIRQMFGDLKFRLGKAPRLIDFARFDLADPTLIAGVKRNYWSLLVHFGEAPTRPSVDEHKVLSFLSGEILNGKRPHELLLLDALIEQGGRISVHDFADLLNSKSVIADSRVIESALRVLSLDFYTKTEKTKFAIPLISFDECDICLAAEFSRLLTSNSQFSEHVADIISTGLYVSRHFYDWSRLLEVGMKYSRKDVCRLLLWKKNHVSSMYGYKTDEATGTIPIFVNYKKDEDISAGTNYKDGFVNQRIMRWFSKKDRKLASNDVSQIISNKFEMHLFVKKKSGGSLDFYYLGVVDSSHAVPTIQPGEDGKQHPIVTMHLNLHSPVDFGLFDYLTAGGAELADRIDLEDFRAPRVDYVHHEPTSLPSPGESETSSEEPTGGTSTYLDGFAIEQDENGTHS